MSLAINFNGAALTAHAALQMNDNNLTQSIQRLSTGYRINSAADDPAGLAISEALQAQVGGLNTAISNAQNAVNVVKTSEGAMQQVQNLLLSMRDLAVNALNTGATDSTSLSADQAQMSSALGALNRIAANTAFAGKKLLDGSAGVAGSLSSGTGGTFVSGTADTKAGVYNVTVTQLASETTYVGQNNGVAATVTGTGDLSVALTSTDAGNVVFTNASGTILGTVALVSGDTLATVQSKITAVTDASGLATVDRVIATNDGANHVVLNQANGGYQQVIDISSSSTTATLNKLGLTAALTHGTGFFTATATAGTLAITAGNSDGTTTLTDVAIAANDTAASLVTRINAASAGVTASADQFGRLTLTSNTYGSHGTITTQVTGGYTAANLFGSTPVTTTGNNVQATVALASGGTGSDVGTANGQVWTGASGKDSSGLELKITDNSAKTMTVTNGSLVFQVGSEVNQTASVAVNGTAADKLGLTATGLETSAQTVADINVTTAAGARDALRLIDAAITEVSTQRSSLGSTQTNVFQSAISSLTVASQNIAASNSQIQNTDMASEMSNFARDQILQQSTVAMLAQANQAPQLLLKLLA